MTEPGLKTKPATAYISKLEMPLMTPDPDLMPHSDSIVDLTHVIDPETESRIRDSYTARVMPIIERERYNALRMEHLNISISLAEICPEGEELDAALKHVQESFFWSLNAIAKAGNSVRREASERLGDPHGDE